METLGGPAGKLLEVLDRDAIAFDIEPPVDEFELHVMRSPAGKLLEVLDGHLWTLSGAGSHGVASSPPWRPGAVTTDRRSGHTSVPSSRLRDIAARISSARAWISGAGRSEAGRAGAYPSRQPRQKPPSRASGGPGTLHSAHSRIRWGGWSGGGSGGSLSVR